MRIMTDDERKFARGLWCATDVRGIEAFYIVQPRVGLTQKCRLCGFEFHPIHMNPARRRSGYGGYGVRGARKGIDRARKARHIEKHGRQIAKWLHAFGFVPNVQAVDERGRVYDYVRGFVDPIDARGTRRGKCPECKQSKLEKGDVRCGACAEKIVHAARETR